MKLTFWVNEKPVELNTEPDRRLLDLLREDLGLTGTKEGCGEGECGACTVILDGEAVHACMVLAIQLEGCHVTTIEGLEENGELSALQKIFAEELRSSAAFAAGHDFVRKSAADAPAPSDG